MNIDEVIEHCNRVCDNTEKIAIARGHKLIDELKCYRNDNDFSKYADKLYKTAYNKAIEDFTEQLHNLCGFEIDDYQYPYLLHEKSIDEIAEKLKERGVKNDN